MNTLPPTSVPTAAAGSNLSDGSANGSSSASSTPGNFHQVLNQQMTHNSASSADNKTASAQAASAPAGGASSKATKSTHSPETQSAASGNASPSAGLSAQQAAAISAAAAQAAQTAQAARRGEGADTGANGEANSGAAQALAGNSAIASQLVNSANNGRGEIEGDSAAQDVAVTADAGKQVGGTSQSSGSAILQGAWGGPDGSNQHQMLTSMGGRTGSGDSSDSADSELSDGSGGSGAGQIFGAGTNAGINAGSSTSVFQLTQNSTITSEQSVFSDTADKAHLSSDIPTAALGDASLAAAQASTTQVPAASPASAGSSVASASVPYQMGSDAWRADVSSHVLYFSQQDISSAQLHLNPAHLSPLNISISVDNNQTTIAFSAAHEATRQAMQDSLPQLREMFNAHGIALGQTTVGDSSAGSAQQQSQNKAQSGAANLSLASKALESSSTAVNGIAGARIRSLQIVDTFA